MDKLKMKSKLLTEIKALVRKKLRDAKLGKKRPESVRKKISQAMKGESNFAGHEHTRATKERMHRSRGRDDQGKVGGTKWYRPTAYTSAKPDRRRKSAVAPQGYKPGRS